MQSLIITSKDKKLREEYALKMCHEQEISTFDITILELSKESAKGSIGIEEVRVIQKNLLLRPLQGKKKAIIISDAHLLTMEAQNALLKMLEEPPAHTTIMLTLPQKDILLPTICSRCHIVELQPEGNRYTLEEITSFKETVINLYSLSINGRLKLAQDIAKNKDEAIIWLEKSMCALRESLLEEVKKDKVEKKYVELLRRFQKAYTLISSTNTNPRLVLENTLLNI